MDAGQNLLSDIKNGNITAFEKLYSQYYVMLCTIAMHFVKNRYVAEELVSDVFIALWEKRDSLTITTSVKAYLARSVQNRSINYLEKLQAEQRMKDNLTDNINSFCIPFDDDYPLGRLFEQELSVIIDKAIKNLPEQCRQIFMLSRNEDLKHEEIAQQLGISINTIKTQIRIALARLRDELKDYTLLIIMSIYFSKNF